jgi:hypothetical protein
LSKRIVNAELCKKAAEKVGNPNVLVNLISRRVRQLNSGGGGLNRPLVTDTANLLGSAGAGRIGPPAAQETPEEVMPFAIYDLRIAPRSKFTS